MSVVIGIDPGKKGALVVVNNGRIENVLRMPMMRIKKKEVVNPATVYSFLDFQEPGLVVIEQVGSMPAQGVASTCTFCRAAGYIEATAFICAFLNRRRPPQFVLPRHWKQWAGLIGQPKKASLAAAEAVFGTDQRAEFFPWVGETGIGIAEAALIAAYGADKLL